MATKKITITFPEELIGQAIELADEAGLPFSTWVAKVAEHEVRIQRGLRAMREWEKEDGPLTDEEIAWADAELAKAEAAVRAARAQIAADAA